MMRRFSDHIAAHPVRLMFTLIIPLLLSSILAVYAIYTSVQANKDRNIAICQQVNDLKIDIYVAFIDFTNAFLPEPEALQAQEAIVDRFIPIENCEAE